MRSLIPGSRKRMKQGSKGHRTRIKHRRRFSKMQRRKDKAILIEALLG